MIWSGIIEVCKDASNAEAAAARATLLKNAKRLSLYEVYNLGKLSQAFRSRLRQSVFHVFRGPEALLYVGATG